MKTFFFTLFLLPLTLLAQSTRLHSDSIDVISYGIHLSIRDFSNKEIGGYTAIRFTPMVNNLTEVHLDLLKLAVDSILLSDTTVSYLYDDTLLKINTLPLSVADTYNLKVYYHGHPVVDPSGWGGFYFSGNTAYNLGVGFKDVPHNYGRVWFPCIDDFVDRAIYDFQIKTDTDKVAVCNGTLESVTTLGDSVKLWHWHLHKSIPTYLASVAVSDYAAMRDTFNSITGQKIPIAIYVAPTLTAKAQTSFSNLNAILSGFEQHFGPYRWERVGYVGVPFNSGAMEHATNIAYPSAVVDGSKTYEYLYAHELSHHWFGDLITCHSAEDMWINEGWAVFSETFYHEFLYGKKSYADYMYKVHRDALLNAHKDDAGWLPLYPMPQRVTYGTTTYQKGATVVHSLRNYLGDSLFFPMVKAYLQHFALSDVSSFQMRDFFSQYTGVDLKPFFEAWVFTPGYLHFSVDSFTVVPNGANYDVTVYVRQRLYHRSSYADSNRFEVILADNQWNMKAVTVQFSGKTGKQTFSLPFKPTIAFDDLYRKTADASFDEFRIINHTGGAYFTNEYFKMNVMALETDSVFFFVQHNWVKPDSIGVLPKGLELVRSRYWKIAGIDIDKIQASGYFSYNFSSTADFGDANYNFGSADSLVLLYRKGTNDYWRPVTSKKSGGRLILDTLKAGEYALGFKNGYTATAILYPQNENIKIFPNPSKTNFTIQLNQSQTTHIKILNIKGQTIDSLDANGKQTLHWTPKNNGVYFLRFFDEEKLLSVKKVVRN